MDELHMEDSEIYQACSDHAQLKVFSVFFHTQSPNFNQSRLGGAQPESPLGPLRL